LRERVRGSRKGMGWQYAEKPALKGTNSMETVKAGGIAPCERGRTLRSGAGKRGDSRGKGGESSWEVTNL